jgi:hypothetical protein
VKTKFITLTFDGEREKMKRNKLDYMNTAKIIIDFDKG